MNKTKELPLEHKKNSKLRIYGIIISILVLVSFTLIDFSSLANFNLDNIKTVFQGLIRPDFAYLYDGSFIDGSMEDLLGLMVITVAIAFLGTMIGTILAIPFTFLSARNLYPKNLQWIPSIGKFILNVLRAFPELVYAIIFVKVVGPGPFAGALAIGVHHIGMLGKLFTEEMESIEDGPLEAHDSVGAKFWQIIFYGVLPQLTAIWTSFSLNHFEIAVRSAATLGLVGAGGVGAPMIFAIQQRNWPRVSVILISIIIMVSAIDSFAAWLRKKVQ